MSYQPVFSGWENLRIADLLVAYRKAKADCFFENTFPAATKFAEYEKNLLKNLEKMLNGLREEHGFAEIIELLGEYRILPKKLSIKSKKLSIKSKSEELNGHIHFSCPKRTFENLTDNNNLIPEFRIIGDFPVEAHIISALWINTIGHKFDARLDKSCYGARLKRVHNDEILDKDAEKPFHISAIGSFTPYFQPYQKWRNDGLKAIRDELEKDRDVIAVSLDLKSYYHYIDPLALESKELHKLLGIELTEAEQSFTRELALFLANWSKGAQEFSKELIKGKSVVSGGLVIGLTASRIISNILLHSWDTLIKTKVTPIHYGRYVDDMFIVLHDPGCIKNTNDFMNFLKERLGENYIAKEIKTAKKETIWRILPNEKPLLGNTQIGLQAEKQKLFILHGQAGLDLLDSIEKEIYELSSEHRLMPSPDQLEDSTAARVLSAAGSVGEQADTLRRADGLTIRRLSWALQLRHVETLARDLPAKEWVSQRKEFYQFAYDHILRPDNLFAHFNYLPRLLGFAISLNEWTQAEQIVLRSFSSIDQLASKVLVGKKIALNGADAKAGENLWRFVKGTLTWMFVDAATRYYDSDRLFINKRSKKESALATLFFKNIIEQLVNINDILKFEFGFEDFDRKAPMVALADLAKKPYKNILSNNSASTIFRKRDRFQENRILANFNKIGLIDTESLKLFLKSTRETRLQKFEKDERPSESLLPYLFPTRPYTPEEIAELAPECVGLHTNNGKPCLDKSTVIWAKYTQAVRGVWVKPTLVAVENDKDESESVNKRRIKKRLYIGTDIKKKIIVALTNIKTDEDDWAFMACDRSNLSLDRYGRIAELINQTIKLRPKPDYVLFPELCLPIKWVESISTRLSSAGISMIAGTEYRHFGNEILSEACLVLSDNRLGFPAFIKIWQPKLEPAVGEDKKLTSIYGKQWAYNKVRSHRAKPIYVHNGVHFGVMVCSELQNSKARIRFQGEVDALMTLSWNQDLETFSSLIEAAALDVHAYTILVNNRMYGDSRVRSPAKESFMRDIARIRGGDNDFVIAASLDIDALRAFQSRAKRWPQDGDKFKPLPEGFKIHPLRKKLPPK